MNQIFYVKGLHCEGCVRSVSQGVLGFEGIQSVHLELATGKLEVDSTTSINKKSLDEKIRTLGKRFELTDGPVAPYVPEIENKKPVTKTREYLPLFVMFGFVVVVAAALTPYHGHYDFHSIMANVMAAFFFVFGGIKLLNLRGFASSYAQYDLIAKKTIAYGYIYPFLEIGFGIGYVMKHSDFYLNLAVFLVMAISALGVAIALKEKNLVKCACLGGFFSVPLSKVTFFEDAIMAAMAAWMLFL